MCMRCNYTELLEKSRPGYTPKRLMPISLSILISTVTIAEIWNVWLLT
jgi:hypothetical protein